MNILFYCAGDDGSMLQAFRKALQVSPFNHTVIHAESENFDVTSVDSAIVWLPPDDFFEGLTNLKTVYALSAGVDRLLQHPGLPVDATIVRLRDAGMASQMAEYVLYGTLRAQRNFHEYEVAQRESRWLHGLAFRRAAETRVGILGAGILGMAVAQKLAASDYAVSCWSRTPKSLPENIKHMHGAAALDPFLSECDVLVCLLPLTDATKGVLDMTLFNKLPKGAFVINAARGEHLVDVDLLNAIDDGQISGAMLDVFHTEPLPSAHPFWLHPRIIITPHDAARSLIDESVGQITRSIGQMDQGVSPDGLVVRSRGY